ncbi:hypothetical protein [Cesiribacter andamanensis]|nr:hypothetical protein [Cesiribacter andamanensis]
MYPFFQLTTRLSLLLFLLLLLKPGERTAQASLGLAYPWQQVVTAPLQQPLVHLLRASS